MDRHRREFALEGFHLQIDGPALDAVVDAAFKKQTGARGISAALLRAIEDAAYDRFGSGESGTILVAMGPDSAPIGRFEPGPGPSKPTPPPRPAQAPYPDPDRQIDPEQALFEIKVQRRAPKPPRR